MPMRIFRDLFPDVARDETRCLTVFSDDAPVPKGHYGLLEFYCDEPGCDCRRVFINVLHAERGEIVATIGFGWESRAFYRRWVTAPVCDREIDGMAGLRLEPMQRQSSIAAEILEMVEQTAFDAAYVERIRRHYRMVKDLVDSTDPDEDSDVRQAPRVGSAGRAGRNAPCSCGSGKKHKRCCGRVAS